MKRLVSLAIGLAACSVDTSRVEIEPAAPVLRRLTRTQYVNALRDLVDERVVVPAVLEPDERVEGLLSVGSSLATVSPLGVERYERAALQVAAQALAADRRAAVSPCAPAGVSDTACFQQFLAKVGRRAWRRALTGEELSSLTAVVSAAAAAKGDGWAGLELGLAALLQSPNFLYRVEVGEPDPERTGARRPTAYELASRVAFFLSDSGPDEALLAAAESGLLHTSEGLRSEARRLLAAPRGRAALRSFFTQLYHLDELDSLSKDTKVFRDATADLGPGAREETLLGLERLVFDEDGDFRTFFTSRRTFVNRRLAALYEVPAPAREGFAEVLLPESSPRRGFLGQASFLALNAHPVATSAVLRGAFVRKVLLCGRIPPPPVNVNTGLPEPNASARTLRERSANHLANESCAGCHALMDPIGLGFEPFDGVGRFRALDHGAPIDASGEIDGMKFSGPAEIGQVVVAHPNFPRCFAGQLFRHATAARVSAGEEELVDVLAQAFVASGWRVKALALDVVTSPAFRRMGEVVP